MLMPTFDMRVNPCVYIYIYTHIYIYINMTGMLVSVSFSDRFLVTSTTEGVEKELLVISCHH